MSLLCQDRTFFIEPLNAPFTDYRGTRQLSLFLSFDKTIFWGKRFGKTESAFKPYALPEYLEGRTPKKTPFPFSKEI